MSVLTHTDLLSGKRRGLFVGREAERRAFRQNFEGDVPEFLYFYIHGQGGIGKSFLVARYRTLARGQGARTALTNEAEATVIQNDSIVQAMERLAQELSDAGASLPAFKPQLTRYRECMREIAADENAPHGFAGRVGRAMTKAAAGAAGETVIGSALIAGGLELAGTTEEAFAQRTGAWGEYIARKFRRNKKDVALLREPVETLTPLFVADVNAVAHARPVVLCFDTWERTGAHLGDWLRELPRQGLSANVWLVIAGRHPPGDEWEPLFPLMACFELETFSTEETLSYLRQQGITGEARVRQILALCGGVPVLVSTLASARGGNATEAAHSLVDRYLKWVDDPLRRQMALRCAAARRLDQDVVAALMGDVPGGARDAGALFDWLVEMPFVQSRPGYWEYHPKVRELMLRYAQTRSDQECKAVHGRLCAYYRGLLEDLGEVARYKDPTGRRYVLEALYHGLMGQATDIVRIGLETFLLSLRRYYPLAGEVVATWKQAIEEKEARHEITAGADTLDTLWTAIEDREWAQALPTAKALAGRTDLCNKARSVAFFAIGLGHGSQGEWKRVVEDYSRAIELNPEYATAYNNRGIAYDNLNEYARAIEDYSRAIELNPEDATAYYNRGIAYRHLNEDARAIEDYSRAIELNPEYATAYYNRGIAYRHLNEDARAIEDYSRAIELNPEYATAYYNRGIAYADSQQYARAIQDFDRAIELDPEDAAAYYNTGCAYALMQDAARACEWLEKAIALDKEYRQNAREDTDFDGIREDARFQALLAAPGSHGTEPPR